MLAVERRNQILEKLQDEKKVVVSELSTRFDVSEETIRRDLDKLEKEGLCKKTYGGAILCEAPGVEMPFMVRRKKNMEGKNKIANLISDLVEDGDHIIVDPSTTSLAIVNALQAKDKRGLTLITNSIEVLLEASEQSDWEIISTGGFLNGKYLALVGPRALDGISAMNADKVILSCKGLDMNKGVTDANELFSQVKQTMLNSGIKKILVVDSTKFDKVAFSKICDPADLDMVVTDSKPSDAWLNYFADKGIRCIYGE